jgi:hypothetical protein
VWLLAKRWRLPRWNLREREPRLAARTPSHDRIEPKKTDFVVYTVRTMENDTDSAVEDVAVAREMQRLGLPCTFVVLRLQRRPDARALPRHQDTAVTIAATSKPKERPVRRGKASEKPSSADAVGVRLTKYFYKSGALECTGDADFDAAAPSAAATSGDGCDGSSARGVCEDSAGGAGGADAANSDDEGPEEQASTHEGAQFEEYMARFQVWRCRLACRSHAVCLPRCARRALRPSCSAPCQR